jgi:cellulose synthase/poly-beta-1,6-N-acetylglucosamine synthase-like glycosyltransferase
MISLRLAGQGYRVIYEPDAYAVEKPSYSVADEMKRKVRICAGGFQSISRLVPLLNPFVHGLLSFQYIGHRVSRWAIAPFCLPVLFLTNFLLYPASGFYAALFALQVVFYALSIVGYLLERRQVRLKALYIPFYFSMMNYTVYLGLYRFLRGRQSGIWEKVRRAV